LPDDRRRAGDGRRVGGLARDALVSQARVGDLEVVDLREQLNITGDVMLVGDRTTSYRRA
jgi:hypothetical protein